MERRHVTCLFSVKKQTELDSCSKKKVRPWLPALGGADRRCPSSASTNEAPTQKRGALRPAGPGEEGPVRTGEDTRDSVPPGRGVPGPETLSGGPQAALWADQLSPSPLPGSTRLQLPVPESVIHTGLVSPTDRAAVPVHPSLQRWGKPQRRRLWTQVAYHRVTRDSGRLPQRPSFPWQSSGVLATAPRNRLNLWPVPV